MQPVSWTACFTSYFRAHIRFGEFCRNTFFKDSRNIFLITKCYFVAVVQRYTWGRGSLCMTAKTVDARTTDLSLSFTSLLNKQKNENEKLKYKNKQKLQ